MKRTVKKVKQDQILGPGEYWWMKKGGGTFQMKINGKMRIIKRNERFAAREEDIPERFRDVIVPANEKMKKVLAEKAAKKNPPQKLQYSLNHRGGGYYDVVDRVGKRQNQKALKQDDAKALLEKLVG